MPDPRPDLPEEMAAAVETLRMALEVLRDGSLTSSMASNAPPALLALATLTEYLERLQRERDEALDRARAGVAAEADYERSEAEKELLLFERLGKQANRRRAAEQRGKVLREALAAYRSALRSGEPETDQLREYGDHALAASKEHAR